MMKRVFGGTLLTAFVAFSMAACGDDPTSPDGTGDLAVTLSQMDGSSTAAALTESSPRFSHVELSSVTSIVVSVNAVQVHRVEDEENGEPGGWVDLGVSEVEIDLIGDLSSDVSLTVAEGELSAGEYDGVRFFFTGATISFDPPQENPSTGETIEEASLVVPSGDQTGIKVPGASFTVEGENTTEFAVMFDDDTSVQNVNITGTNEVMMAPVLVADSDGGV